MDPDAAIENLRQAIRVWREAVVSGSADAEHETAAEVISTVENLDDWLSRGGHPPGAWAPRAPAPPDADAAYATYAEAASRFARAVEYQAAKRVRSDFPAATSIHLASEYGEDLVLHVRLVAVNGPTGLLADNRNGSEVWDELTGEIEPYLSWLGQLESDDWTGLHQLDLESLLGPPMSTPDPAPDHPTPPEGERQ